MQTQSPSAPSDAGLICPRCEYNLTGLAEPQCPECGYRSTWMEVQVYSASPPRIAFERRHARRFVSGFIITWFDVLLRPSLFAAQSVQRCQLRSGLLFGGLCFLSTLLALTVGADAPTLLTWIATGIIYIIAQAIILTAIDWPHWKMPAQSLAFWLAIGGYTSAVVVTEFYFGPPMIDFDTLKALIHFRSPSGWISMPSTPSVHWPQVLLWLLGLALIMKARLKRAGVPLVLRIAAAVLTAIGLFVLYAAAITFVAQPLYGWIGKHLDRSGALG